MVLKYAVGFLALIFIGMIALLILAPDAEIEPQTPTEEIDQVNPFLQVDHPYLIQLQPTTSIIQEDFETIPKGELTGEATYPQGKDGKGFLKTNGYTILAYDNEDGKYVHPNAGTVEFWLAPKGNIMAEPKHTLFYANTGNNRWSIDIYKTLLTITREFDPCIKSVNRVNFLFQRSEWYKLKLTWSGEVTRFYVNGRLIGDFKFRQTTPDIPFKDTIHVGDNIFMIDNLKISHKTSLPIEELRIDESQDIVCSIGQQLQETYKEIELHSFPDTTEIKKLINLLPTTEGIRSITLVNEEKFEETFGTSIANTREQRIYLKQSYFDTQEKILKNAKEFFHQVAHAFLAEKNLEYQGPSSDASRKQWADISEITFYTGKTNNPQEFLLKNGFLTNYAATTPDEDLAEFTGITYDLYLKGNTFSNLLNPNAENYDIKFQKKLNFLLSKDFITQDIYDAVSERTSNEGEYAVFN